MRNLLRAAAIALALAGSAIGGIASPATAATYQYGTPDAHFSIHFGPRYHPRHWHQHRVKVCHVKVRWHHHHRVRIRTCHWEWRPRHPHYRY